MKRHLTIDANYKVLSIEGSTKYLPGTQLSKKQVDSLLSTKSWSVKIVEEEKKK